VKLIPATSENITAYLQLRGKRKGFENPITFYSIRRRSGTDLARVLGPDRARLLLGQDPNTRTLERYYINYVPTTDLSALALGEQQDIAAMERMDAPLAINALSPEALKRTHGTALNAMVWKLIENDDDYPFSGSEAVQKNYRRLVNKVAYKILLSDEVQKQRGDITMMEVNDRIKALDTSDLMETVFEKAKQLLTATPQNDITEQDVGLPINVDEDGQFEEVPVFEEPEEDLEDLCGPTEGLVIRETDEFGAEEVDGVETDIPYAIAVKLFMETILTNAMSTYVDLKNNPVHCSLCLQDDSVSQQAKVSYHNTSPPSGI
jgi:hypothetical protein